MNTKEKFIADLYPAARKIGAETGMSWELILAQAAQETGWGQRILPGTNNIFNIKSHGGWNSESKTFNVWEIEGGKKVWKDQSFRVYDSIEEALRDRVAFLKENPRYAKAGLFEPSAAGNLDREATALQKAGYATDPHYAKSLSAVFNGPTMQRGIALAVGERVQSMAPVVKELAAADGVLRQGERGAEVKALQETLNRLGFRDAEGRALKIDGHFGAGTEDALRAFQRDTGIREDGIAGPRVKVALERAERLARAPVVEMDGLLRPGMRGPAVRLLQESLDKLGYRDAQGQPLHADGHFGARTEEALRAFQRDRGLQVDGIAGLQTLQAIKRAERTPLLTDVCNGDHGMYQQALAGVHRLDAQHNRTPDQRSEQLAAALVVEAKRMGLERIDDVVVGRDAERMFAVQKGTHAIFDRHAYVDTMPALNQTIARSSEELVQVNQASAQQARAAELQRQQLPEPTQRTHGLSR